MSNIWFTSDLHIGHKRILSLTDRPFDSLDEMLESMVETHNSMVKPGDTVYMLGDIIMGGWKDHIHLIDRFNGHKVLIAGNHDQPFIHKGKSSFSRIMNGYGEHFQEIHVGNARFGRFVLSHFPYDADHTDDSRYMEFRPVDKGYTLIHGHVHEEDPDRQVTFTSKGTKQIHVGVDGRDFTPISIDEIHDIDRS